MAVLLNADRRLVPVVSAAEYGSVHPNTVRKHLKDGRLTEYRLGRDIRVDLDELDALLGNVDPVERLADHIRRVLAQAPPLTDDQRANLSDLIRGGAR